MRRDEDLLDVFLLPFALIVAIPVWLFVCVGGLLQWAGGAIKNGALYVWALVRRE